MANTYVTTRDSIILSALRKLGVVPQGDLPDPEQVVEGAQALEDLLKHLQASTELRWNVVQRTCAIPAGTTDITLTDPATTTAYRDLIDIYSLYLENTEGQTFNLSLMDSNFFDKHYRNNASNEAANSSVAMVRFQRDTTTNLPSTVLTIFPAPTVALTLKYTAVVKQANAGHSTNEIQMDEMWMRVLKYGLACDLADEYTVNLERTQRLEAKYATLLEEAQRKSRNTKDTFFVYPV